MRQRLGVISAWVLATAVSVAIASSAVATVQDEVTASPSPLRTQAVQALAASTTVPPAPTVQPPVTTTSSSPTTTGAAESTTTVAPATTAPAAATTTTTVAVATTSAPPATTTTVAAPGPEFRSYELVGGSVRIRILGTQVFFAGATPAPGFDVDVEEQGPEKVVVEFETPEHESKFVAKFEDGELDVKISEEDHA